MKKDNVMFGVIGLLLGLIIGFIGTNSMNRSGMTAAPTAVGSAGDLAAAGGSNQALPPNHPPIGSTSGAGGPAGNAPTVDCNALPPGLAAGKSKAQQNPQDYEAQMKGADLLYQGQCFDDAAKFYEAAAMLKPTEKEPVVKAGNAYFDGEKYQEAEKWYTQALARDPKDVDVRTDLGLTFFLREPRNIDKAIENYKASLSIDPKHEITLQNLAIALKEKGDTAGYQKTLDELRAVDPNNPALTQLK